MQVGKAGLVFSCQVPGFFIDMASKTNTKSRGLQQFYSCLKFGFINRPCRRNDADGISLP